MNPEEQRKMATELFDELAEALVAKGWVVSGRPGSRELSWKSLDEFALIKVLTNSGRPGSPSPPSVRIDRLNRGTYWQGPGVKEAMREALALMEMEEGPREKVAVARLSVTWSSIGTAAQVAAALESLAAKIRSEGDPVDLRATLRYESTALKEKGLR